VDPSLALRSARLHAGLSQRQLADAAGVDRRMVDRIEAGVVCPRWDTMETLLGACGLDAIPGNRPDRVDDTDLDFWRLSTTARLYASLGGRLHHRGDSRLGVWLELGRTARRTVVILSPEAGLGVWLPRYQAPQPLPVLVSAPIDGPAPEHLALEAREEPPSGLVPVGVTYNHHVLVQAPASLALTVRDPDRAAQLRGVATLLHDRQDLDAQDRRRPAHRSVDLRREQDWVMTRRRFMAVADRGPDARERRDWRLGGEASFRTWLLRHGYPLEQYGHRHSGP
jgi:transcriptional regulator with XRE-family HTH domain